MLAPTSSLANGTNLDPVLSAPFTILRCTEILGWGAVWGPGGGRGVLESIYGRGVTSGDLIKGA